jgi:hypothetical protein
VALYRGPTFDAEMGVDPSRFWLDYVVTGADGTVLAGESLSAIAASGGADGCTLVREWIANTVQLMVEQSGDSAVMAPSMVVPSLRHSAEVRPWARRPGRPV